MARGECVSLRSVGAGSRSERGKWRREQDQDA